MMINNDLVDNLSDPKPNIVRFFDAGKIRYADAWDLQTRFHEEAKALKIKNRREHLAAVPQHTLIFCEHDPVYTLGKSGSMDHLLKSMEDLTKEGFEFFKVNRGGDITYHGPGQITGYPILDLDTFFTDVHKYVRLLEQTIIDVCAYYDLQAGREDGYTGVWIHNKDPLYPKRKICAIGVHLSRWVTMHGFAFNVSTDINHFKNIIPCGISDEDTAVTTLEKEIKKKVEMKEVKTVLLNSFAANFKCHISNYQIS